MKAMKILLASSLLVVALPSMAAPLTLDFEDATAEFDLIEVGDRYQSLGASFSPGALMAMSRKIDSTAPGNFYGPGGELNNIGAVTQRSSTGKFTITTTESWDGFFSLIYGGVSNVVLTAHLLNGNTVSTSVSGPTGLCEGNAYVCNWASLSLDLKGQAATSFDVVVQSGDVWLDNISFSDAVTDPGTPVPEPGGVALSLAALGALAWSRKRSKG